MKPLLRSFQPTKVPLVAPVTLLGLIVLLATSLVAQAELETHWIADFGKYSAATNWSTGAVPNNDASTVYSVVINQGTVFVDQSAIISSLRIGMNGALVDRSGATIANSTLTADTMVNEGTINDFRGLVLNVSGDVFNSGTITVQLGRAAATLGNTYNSGFIGNTSQGGFLTVNGTLTNEGGVRNGSSFVVNGDLNNTGTVSGDIQSNTSITGDVYNNGTLGLSGRAQIGGNVENHGTMSTAGPASSVGALNSDGILRIASRALNAGEIVTSGTMSLGSRIFTSAFEQQEAGLWQERFDTSLGFGIVAASEFLDLHGTLDLSPLSNVPLTLGQTFDLATFPPGRLSGAFSTIVGNSFSNGTLMFQINYDETAGRIRLTVVPAGSQEVIFTP